MSKLLWNLPGRHVGGISQRNTGVTPSSPSAALTLFVLLNRNCSLNPEKNLIYSKQKGFWLSTNMGSLKTAFYLGVCLSAWIITTADGVSLPKAENVLWVSLDFKTILTWTTTSSNDTYTVLYSWDDSNWEESPDCIRVSESECDLTNCLDPLNRTADRLVSEGKDIANAKQLYDHLLNVRTSVQLFCVDEEAVDKAVQRMPKRLLVVPSTMRLYRIITLTPGK
ncbi:tissue factor-like, partial [Scomber scombrus]